MGVTCLGLPRERLRRDAATWQRRAAVMTAALKEHAGWEVRAAHKQQGWEAGVGRRPLPSPLPPYAPHTHMAASQVFECVPPDPPGPWYERMCCSLPPTFCQAAARPSGLASSANALTPLTDLTSPTPSSTYPGRRTCLAAACTSGRAHG